MKKFYICYFFIILTLFCVLNYFKKEKIHKNEAEKIVNFNSLVDFKIGGGSLINKSYQGELFYSDPKKICLFLRYYKEEIEIGSNEVYFWYSSSFEKDKLYYGKVIESHNILKEIFNPINIREIIFPKVEKKNGIQEDHTVGNFGVQLKRQIFIENSLIKKQLVVDNNDNIVYKVIYSSFNGNLPTNYRIEYFNNENYVILIKLKNISVNQNNNFDFTLPLNRFKIKEKLSP